MFDYDPYAQLDPVPAFDLRSADVAHGEQIPLSMYGPDMGGTARSPQLEWSGFPEGTKSFALTCFDPDAPTGSGYWHWAVYNIPASVTSIDADAGASPLSLPAGATALRNDSGEPAFVGAGPPEGTGVHRYMFVVHAVDTERLEIPKGASPAVLGFNLHFHTLARAILAPVGEFDATR